MRKHILVGIMCVLLVSLFTVDYTTMPVIDKIEEHTAIVLSDYVTHDPIQIFSDADFETQGWPGSGTVEDPYVIERLTINGWQEPYHCIYLRHFESSVIVRNCYLDSGTGIDVYNTSGNVLIDNCHFVDMEVGINVNNYVSMVNITDNLFYHIYGAHITNNRAFDMGTHVDGSSFFIDNNTILDGSYAYVHSADNTIITNNIFKIRFEYTSTSGFVEYNCFNASMNEYDQSHTLDFDFNYYKAYNGSDSNLDGIGDTPFTFNKTYDEHPLMYWPWANTTTSSTTASGISTTTTSNTTQFDEIPFVMIISVVGGVCGIVSLVLVIIMIRKK